MIYKIVLTGGPCAGKSTSIVKLETKLTKLGYKVYIVAETATELLNGAISPLEVSQRTFQEDILKIQLAKEKAYLKAAQEMESVYENIVIIFDRGAIDAEAYMGKKEFGRMLKDLGLKKVHLRDFYDGVFHLVTAADGAAEFYGKTTNAKRLEDDLQDAIDADKRTLQAWVGHPHLRVIDNSTDFEHKIQRLCMEIYTMLGEPTPVEIERKFLIKMPDLDLLQSTYHCHKADILQMYLNSDTHNIERRVRQRGSEDGYSYYYTEKIKKSDLERYEKEKKLAQDDYLDLLMQVKTNYNPIRKTRYCLVYNTQYIELDVYPLWNNHAIVEVELSAVDAPVTLPPEIELIAEVTNFPQYRNESIARDGLPELLHF